MWAAEPANVRHYTPDFRLVKVQLSSFVTLSFQLFNRPPACPDSTDSRCTRDTGRCEQV